MNPSFLPVPALLLRDDELIIDNFAGGGGASTAIEWATGRSPDIAINHDPEALAMHAANHPTTRHYCESVWDVDPVTVTEGKPVGILWCSPDCTFFSKARGGKPFRDRKKARRRRGLPWLMVRWAKAVQPRVMFMENVEEIEHWAPLTPDGRIDPKKKGATWRRFLAQLRNLGYDVAYGLMRASEWGAPTKRRRLFLVARNDGLPIVWPEPTHGPGRAHPFDVTANHIDWTIPCPSIFGRKRPLAENTMRRIARGIQRFVIDAKEPFIVNNMTGNVPQPVSEPLSTVLTGGHKLLAVPYLAPLTHQGDARVHAPNEPMPTITAAHRGEHALITPFIVPAKTWGGGGNGPRALDEPMGTVTTSKRGEHAIVTPFLARLGQTNGNGDYVNEAGEPLTTITTKAEHMIIAPTLIQTGYGEREGQAPRALDLHQPLGTIVAEGVKHALVTSFLAKHYGGHETPGSPLDNPIDTITTTDHHSLVTCHLQRDFGHSVGDKIDEPIPTITPGGGGKAALVTSHLVHMRGGLADHPTTGQDLREPLATITASGTHAAEVRAFLVKYYGSDSTPSLAEPLDTITTKDRFGLVMIHGEPWEIVDIGLRMLTPRELFNCQGFPPGYKIIVEYKGKPLSQTSQVRMCGNAVSPWPAACLIRSQFLPAVAGQVPPARHPSARGALPVQLGLFDALA